ncbi:heme-degrading domain-containing protein [Leifsonia sp. NPDC014704]|uniref:heme-degrading domain-containing protein n=1 Tax=Leifsonia sp. NPDC014704 TaxID=3364123 RepID=UPI0036F4AD10
MTDLSIPFLEQQERELVLPSFDLAAAWRLGSLIIERALAAGAGVAVDIRRGDHILFRAMLPGTTVDQQDWIRKKAAVVHRFEASSALVALRLADVDVEGLGWLDARDYALTGGSFPIRVAGTGVIGAVTASGLTSEEDHLLVTDGIREYLASLGE